jgi:hypothetical protein
MYQTDTELIPTVQVPPDSLRIFRIVYPDTKDRSSGVIGWRKFVGAMVDAGFQTTQIGGSAVIFSKGSGRIIFHKPNPVAKIGPVMLATFGKRLRKWFDGTSSVAGHTSSKTIILPRTPRQQHTQWQQAGIVDLCKAAHGKRPCHRLNAFLSSQKSPASVRRSTAGSEKPNPPPIRSYRRHSSSPSRRPGIFRSVETRLSCCNSALRMPSA